MPIVRFDIDIIDNATTDEVADSLVRLKRQLEWLLNGNLDDKNLRSGVGSGVDTVVEIKDGSASGNATVKSISIDGTTANALTERKVTRGSDNNFYEERVVDKWQQGEFMSLADSAGFPIYTAANPSAIIAVKRITIGVTVAGLYTFNFVRQDNSAEFTFFKARLFAGESKTFEFDGNVSAYVGGRIKVYNNTGDTTTNSYVNTWFSGWEKS